MKKRDSATVSTTRIITIGNSQKDSELIKDILAYMNEKKFHSAADTVRSLCEDALAMKKALK